MNQRHGMTLLELVVVLAVLVATSSVLVPIFSGTLQTAQEEATKRTLISARDALISYWSDTRLIAMDGIGTTAVENNRLDLIWLFRNPVSDDLSVDYNASTRIGWQGPYLVASTGDQITTGYPFLIDAWNHEIIVQDVSPASIPRDVRLVSAGSDGIIDIPAGTATASLTLNDVGDDLYVALHLR